MQSSLRHKAEKTNGFQGNRLAAGIGSGDDDHSEVLTQTKIDRHYLTSEQWVPGLAKVQLAIQISPRLACIDETGETSLGQVQIDLGQQLHCQIYIRAILSHLLRQIQQDPINLLPLCQLQLA